MYSQTAVIFRASGGLGLSAVDSNWKTLVMSSMD